MARGREPAPDGYVVGRITEDGVLELPWTTAVFERPSVAIRERDDARAEKGAGLADLKVFALIVMLT